MTTNRVAMNFFTRGPYKTQKQTKECGPFKCQSCHKEFAGKSGLWRHLKRRLDEEDTKHETIKGSIKSIKELVESIQRIAKDINDKLDILNIS